MNDRMGAEMAELFNRWNNRGESFVDMAKELSAAILALVITQPDPRARLEELFVGFREELELWLARGAASKMPD